VPTIKKISFLTGILAIVLVLVVLILILVVLVLVLIDLIKVLILVLIVLIVVFVLIFAQDSCTSFFALLSLLFSQNGKNILAAQKILVKFLFVSRLYKKKHTAKMPCVFI